MRLLPTLPRLRVLPGRLRPSSLSGPRSADLPPPCLGSRRPPRVRRFDPLGTWCRTRTTRSSGHRPGRRCRSTDGEGPARKLGVATASAGRPGSRDVPVHGHRSRALGASGVGRCVRIVRRYRRRSEPAAGLHAKAPTAGPARSRSAPFAPDRGAPLQVTAVSARGVLAALAAFATFAALAAFTGVAAASAGGGESPAEPGPTAPQATEAPAPAAADRAWPVTGPAGTRPTILRGWEPPPAPWAPGHRGVDLAAAPGATVRAAAPGEITFAGVVAGRGVVTVQLSGTGEQPLRTTYEPVHASVRKGDRVEAGQSVGVLQQGPFHCHEPCLHWGLLRGKTYLDPLTLLPPSMRRSGPSRLLPLTGVPIPPDMQLGGDTSKGRGGREEGGLRAEQDHRELAEQQEALHGAAYRLTVQADRGAVGSPVSWERERALTVRSAPVCGSSRPGRRGGASAAGRERAGPSG
ncbi:M23 family metallopeptidase [Streptomyces catenulae]|uniref:M23 family metallopeptidase n=2 Tax=Streptomyces catenulae TaxID=66875 RepID=A0ABV2YUM6_9ACTN